MGERRTSFGFGFEFFIICVADRGWSLQIQVAKVTQSDPRHRREPQSAFHANHAPARAEYQKSRTECASRSVTLPIAASRAMTRSDCQIGLDEAAQQ